MIQSKPAKVRGKSVIKTVFGDYTGELKRKKEIIEAEIKFDYMKLENDIKLNIMNINRLLLGHQKFLWYTCGLLSADVVVEKISNMRSRKNQINKTREGSVISGSGSGSGNKTNSLLSTRTERGSIDHRRKVIEKEIRKDDITKNVTLKNKMKENATASRSESLLKTQLKLKLGSESGSRVSSFPVIAPFVQAGEGYTCGLWLLLHFITGLQ